jgi:hypothetical protein
VVGLGGNNLGRAGTAMETAAGVAAVVNVATDAGLNLFETADSYGKTPIECHRRHLPTRSRDDVRPVEPESFSVARAAATARTGHRSLTRGRGP